MQHKTMVARRDAQSLSPFQENAVFQRQAGLCPIPCGGDDGKTPQVKSSGWSLPPTEAVIQQWVADPRFADANIGILTGLSGVTIVDVDDNCDVDRAVAQFGETQMVVETPSGGRHLWYRSSGEKSANLRGLGRVDGFDQ